MRWVGLSGKQHDIVSVNGVRVGILAFCGVYGQCKDATGGAPFVPLKYTPKVATGAVNELNEVRYLATNINLLKPCYLIFL